MFLEEKRIKKKKKEAAKQKKCLWVLVLVLSMDISLEKLVLCSPTDTLTYISHREVVPCQLSTIRSTTARICSASQQAQQILLSLT